MNNGHRSVKLIKFQSIVAPNGIVKNLEGLYKWRNYNAGLIAEARLLQ